jgi:hypothetical protein
MDVAETKDVENPRKTHPVGEDRKGEFADVEVDSSRPSVDGVECEMSGLALEDALDRPLSKETL